MTARILIIAGSDSGGGAGIQADIKTVTMLGGHAMTAITAVTAQNTLGVEAVHLIPTEMVIAQIDAVVSDIGVDAVKIGMIGSAQTAHAVADRLKALDVPIVFDPVMIATSGAALADAETIAAFERLMRIASLVTPNSDELKILSGSDDVTDIGVFESAGELAERNSGGVLATGTRMYGGRIAGRSTDGRAFEYSTDRRMFDRLFTSDAEGGFQEWSWDAEVIDSRHTHGTGCTLASAIAVGLAEKLTLPDAIQRARQFVRLAIRDAPGLGRGHGPMGHAKVREDALVPGISLNQVTVGASNSAASIAFYKALGLRQIVDSPDNGYARFEADNGVTFSIHAAEKGAGGATVYFESRRLDAWVAELIAAGLVFDQLPQDESWLWREARLRDPHGNMVCLYSAGENRRFPPWRL
jgi:hydroxymethylpyrimidine/phosphomethylpyrimidine kinase